MSDWRKENLCCIVAKVPNTMPCGYKESENNPNEWDDLVKIFWQSIEIATSWFLLLIVKYGRIKVS